MGETDERKRSYGEEELKGIDGAEWHETAEEGIRELWRETGGEKEHERCEAAERAKFERIERGLAKCMVCGGAAKIVTFGAKGEGVWIGCAETSDCARQIEIHTEGWSIEEAAERWNRYNRGVLGMIRRMKMWWRRNIGAERRARRAEERRMREIKGAREARLREVFGIKVGEGRKRWWKFW